MAMAASSRYADAFVPTLKKAVDLTPGLADVNSVPVEDGADDSDEVSGALFS